MKTGRRMPRLFRPSVYQGRKTPRSYFEGWYFKLVDLRGDHIWSVIPGVSYSENTHCFVQAIHANSGRTYNLTYPIDTFKYTKDNFLVNVGPNVFSDSRIYLKLESEDLAIRGEIVFEDKHSYPSKLFSPGIMGWYTFAPFMECYHGVVSMQHQLSGILEINGSGINFSGGKGYIEKDWGKSMPSDWIWMQSNHFNNDAQASFMLSLARIPWLNGHFPGFLSFLYINGRVYRFATYNRTKVQYLQVTPEWVRVSLKNKHHQLEVKVQRQEGGILKAPKHGNMDREIKESIISTLNLELKNHSGEIIFSDKGRFAGLEIVGDMEQYYRNIN